MTEKNKGEIFYLGHASLRITTPDGKVIYIDPFAGKDYDISADLILVTHQHFDHNQIDLPAKKENTVVLQNFDFHKDGKYLTKEIDGIMVEAVEAYNKNHKKEECVGYLITTGDTTIYVPGDTGMTEQMKELKDRNIDIAFMPIDGVYTMNPKQALECAELIQAKTVIPYHTKVGEDFNLEQAKKFKADNAYILKNGESLSF